MSHPQPSRRRYRAFVQDYKQRRLDDGTEPGKESPPSASPMPWSGKRRDYLRDYLRWLWPHRFELAGVFVLALIVAGLEMIEPLFMRFIIDRVLLNTSMDTRREALRAAPRRHGVRRGDPALESHARAQGLPPEAVEREGHAVAAPVAVRPPAASAAVEAVGHEDGRHPVASDRRRGNDDGPAADGGDLADALAGAPDHRGEHPDGDELAPGSHRADHHPRGDGDELRVHPANPADLPIRPQGRRSD